ncbi:MAG: UDP-N-acetylmuramate--L-alanine ligase, partial [Gammaproteobacteria bacterium]|nr:UDP-N-acetylmuramate--L-alanine ligase [Gammaproteobacteria bacterium]
LHFVGIGGAGMSALAELLHHNGYTVSGSDLVMNDAVKRLRQYGVIIYDGHQACQIGGVEQVIFSTAIADNNIEIVAARQQNIPLYHRSELLAQLVQTHHGIAVIGSHGKTTTAALITALLHTAGLTPAFVIGAVLQQPLPAGHLDAANQQQVCYLVTEADESDGSFMRLQPKIVVITNIDADHLSYYGGNLTALQHSFITFLKNLTPETVVLICHDDPRLVEIIGQIDCRVVTYGFHVDADVRVQTFYQRGEKNFFQLEGITELPVWIELNQLPGRHNVLNALAAAALATVIDIDIAVVTKTFKQFSGVERRFQLFQKNIFSSRGALVIEDYGHHPNELRAVIEAIGSGWPDRRLIVVFQPHRFSRTHDLFADFVAVLSSLICLYLLPLYSAGEKEITGASSWDLYQALKPMMAERLQFVGDISTLRQQLEYDVCQGDIILMQGAGDIHEITRTLVN